VILLISVMGAVVCSWYYSKPLVSISNAAKRMTTLDKSRNRNSGGSGLGLYITKTILDHHEIIHNMVNTENGVKFTAFLW
jgi:signal transduction histidine kinase